MRSSLSKTLFSGALHGLPDFKDFIFVIPNIRKTLRYLARLMDLKVGHYYFGGAYGAY